jgi:8-oxo-dGTP pyrophosphatase MutT (NUDIX family)
MRAGRICLVLSRGGKRWVVPKGCIEPGQTAGETALQEAWEEAGLVGMLGREPLGSYLYEKAGATCHVTVFHMQVTHSANDWPERTWRRRLWLAAPQVEARIQDLGLRKLVRHFLAAHHAILLPAHASLR